MAGCFRCAYVWRPRRGMPARCPRCKSRLWDVPRLRAVRAGQGRGIPEIVLPKRAEFLVALARFGARNPRVFGSVARSDARPNSDLDLLVDFAPGATIWDQIGLKLALEELFHRTVDVVSEGGLNWLVRPQVLFEAVPV